MRKYTMPVALAPQTLIETMKPLSQRRGLKSITEPEEGDTTARHSMPRQITQSRSIVINLTLFCISDLLLASLLACLDVLYERLFVYHPPVLSIRQDTYVSQSELHEALIHQIHGRTHI